MEKEIEKIIPAVRIRQNLKVGITSLTLGVITVLLILLINPF